ARITRVPRAIPTSSARSPRRWSAGTPRPGAPSMTGPTSPPAPGPRERSASRRERTGRRAGPAGPAVVLPAGGLDAGIDLAGVDAGHVPLREADPEPSVLDADRLGLVARLQCPC